MDSFTRARVSFVVSRARDRDGVVVDVVVVVTSARRALWRRNSPQRGARRAHVAASREAMGGESKRRCASIASGRGRRATTLTVERF